MRMQVTKKEVEKKEQLEKYTAARQWKTKLWAGEWEKFIEETDSKYTKSTPLISRLEMLKNAISFGFPTLALQIYKTRNMINGTIDASPRNLRNLEGYRELLNATSEKEFLVQAFGTAYEILLNNDIEDKGEHLFYLVRSRAEKNDFDDFIEARILNGLPKADYYEKIELSKTEAVTIESEISFDDYISIFQVCLWHSNDEDIQEVSNIIQELWIRKYSRDFTNIRKLISTNNSDNMYDPAHPYPVLNVADINDKEILNSLYDELRLAIDQFSYLIKKSENRSDLDMSDIQDYVYLQKIAENGEIKYYTKKEFSDEDIYTRQTVVNNLYNSYNSMLLRMDSISPI